MLPIKIQELPQHNSSLPLKLFLLNNLGTSTHLNCRLLLREQLSLSLEQAGYVSPADLLDLQKRPEHEKLNISLSHGPHHSLMGWIAKPYGLGVDIEVLDRLSKEIIERISTPEERTLALSAGLETRGLWSAKEAAFKALFPLFNVVSSVEIVDWSTKTPQCWTFGVELKNRSEGYGELCLIERHSIAFFTLPT